jgi:hypothetical protein
MKIKLKKSSDPKSTYDITQLVESVTYSGTQTQASRKIEFTIAFSPLDGDFPDISVSLGDKIYFTEGAESFVGRVTKENHPSSAGVKSFSASDFMNLLLKSKRSYNFKNTSPEKIAQKVISDAGLLAGEIYKSKINIKKWIVESESPYNIILGAYQKAHRRTGKSFRLCMDGVKICVKELSESSGVTLTSGDSIISAELTNDAEDIVNRVYIVDENNKKVGFVDDKDSIKTFGLFTDVYKKEDGVNAETAAKALLKGATKEIGPIEAVGDIRCMSGKSVLIREETSGLVGKFWITEDTHTFSGGVHTMSLKLSFEKIMEGYDEKSKKVAAPDEVCYYSTGSKKYHSDRKCGTGLVKPVKSTVAEAEKTGRDKCSMCWA